MIEPRLTYSQLLTEDCPFSQRGTVPASISKLVLTLIDAHLGAFTYNDDGVWATLADGPLARCQPGNLVADDVGTQSHHWGQGPAKVRETHTHSFIHTHQWTHTNTNIHTHTESVRTSKRWSDWLSYVRLSTTGFNSTSDWCMFRSEVKAVLQESIAP